MKKKDLPRFHLFLNIIKKPAISIWQKRIMAGLFTTLLATVFISEPARAVPSFARQTGMSCVACHTTFPELTSFGRTFKLNGYTFTGIKTIDSQNANNKSVLNLLTIGSLSVMVQSSFTHLNTKVPDKQNDNFAYPQQLSLFYAGQITPHLGTFIQLTYDDQGGTIGMDNADIRYANHASLGSKDLIYGFTLNNNPTVQDIWNSTPAWAFPYAASGTAPSPAAATLVEGGLEQSVAGLGAYAFFNNLVYGEFTIYRSAQQGAPNPPDTNSEMIVKGVAPYWRLALQHQWANHYLEIGTYGLSSQIYPMGTSGLTDKYTDIAFDLQYQYSFSSNYLTLHSTYIHETQDLNATFDAEGAQYKSNNLNTFKIDANVFLKHGFAFALGYFKVNGSSDNGLFGPESVDGSRLSLPDSDGLLAEIDYLPWINTKLSLQYIMYNKFNGAKTNYDGYNRKAGGNNTLYVLLWINF